MPVSFEFPISLDVNQLLEFIKQIRLEQRQQLRSAKETRLASFRALVLGLALHPVSQHVVNNRYTSNPLTSIGDADVQQGTKHDKVVQIKKWVIITETAFKDTFIAEVEAGVAARALLNLTWLLCKDGGNFGATQIFQELQSLYGEALSHHGSFETADRGIIMQACEKLAADMQYAVQASLYGSYADKRPSYGKLFMNKTVQLYKPISDNG